MCACNGTSIVLKIMVFVQGHKTCGIGAMDA